MTPELTDRLLYFANTLANEEAQLVEDAAKQLDSLRRELREARQERDLNADELRALKFTIVTTIGGVDYEGFPTSAINYLQRLRILVEKEEMLRTSEQERERLQSALKAAKFSLEMCRHDRCTDWSAAETLAAIAKLENG